MTEMEMILNEMAEEAWNNTIEMMEEDAWADDWAEDFEAKMFWEIECR